MVIFFGTETSPSSGDSSPTINRKSVVLPAPLGPTSPARSPGFNWNDASTKMSCLPYCLVTLFSEIIRGGRNVLEAIGISSRQRLIDQPGAPLDRGIYQPVPSVAMME